MPNETNRCNDTAGQHYHLNACDTVNKTMITTRSQGWAWVMIFPTLVHASLHLIYSMVAWGLASEQCSWTRHCSIQS